MTKLLAACLVEARSRLVALGAFDKKIAMDQ